MFSKPLVAGGERDRFLAFLPSKKLQEDKKWPIAAAFAIYR